MMQVHGGSWTMHAEAMLGAKRLRARGDLDAKLFNRPTPASDVTDQAISVRAFAREFGPLGTLTIARGVHRGVYQHRKRVDA